LAIQFCLGKYKRRAHAATWTSSKRKGRTRLAGSVHCSPPQPFRDPQGRNPGFRPFFVQPLAGKQEVAGSSPVAPASFLLRGFRESPARERNPNPLSRLFDEFCSSSGATASKIAACPPVLVCSLPE
jgi:hypothetical protein